MRLLKNRPSPVTDLRHPDLARVRLTPQMLDYDDFASRGHSQYLPYVMSFNRPGFRSAAISTDDLGFRYTTTAQGDAVSVGDIGPVSGRPVNLVSGGSLALGYGSTSDANAMTSRLAALDPGGAPWLNMAGHCFNSAQELLLFVLHQHRLPQIENIVIVGGFNSLVMARLPEFDRAGLPAFYFCGEYYEKFDELRVSNGGTASSQPLPVWPSDALAVPPIEQTVERGAAETLRRLRTWHQIAEAIGARLTFLLQPLATWVREPSTEERELFDELDRISRLGTWAGLYGDISTQEAGESYGQALQAGCEELGVPFGNLIHDLRALPADDWLYVDRAHLTDHGNDRAAVAVLNHLHG